ncbi:hypothetical protein N431DRAFT_448574 [Stipitochalara longipes BDJ]|nr:hypothetical protein N431DRAFT_448574 [Stipitochalara longipes BDJ]
MEDNAMDAAKSLEKATHTSSPWTPSIFGTPAIETLSAVGGDPSTHDVALQERILGMKLHEKQDSQDSSSAMLDTASLERKTTEQDSPTGEGNIAGNITAPTSARVPYNNGFGDFYFGSLTKYQKPKITEDMSKEEKLDRMGITGSNGIPVVELDNFQRSGNFPYTKLPFEIRERSLEFFFNPSSLNFMMGTKKSTSVSRATQNMKTMRYPGREFTYDLTLTPVRSEFRHGPAKDWVFLEWLRKVSHHNGVLMDLTMVISARPAILPGLKDVLVNLRIAKGQVLDSDFEYFCESLAQKFDLECANFHIEVTEGDLKEFMNGEKNGLDGLSATSKLRVSKEFGLTLERMYDEDDFSVDDWDEPLDPEYRDVLWYYMLPLTLRDLNNQEPETEEEEYLQARFEEFGGTERAEQHELEETGEGEAPEQDEESRETNRAVEIDEAERREHVGEKGDTTQAHVNTCSPDNKREEETADVIHRLEMDKTTKFNISSMKVLLGNTCLVVGWVKSCACSTPKEMD